MEKWLVPFWNIPLNMERFAESVNRFLEFNEYRILEGFGSVTRKQAEGKAFTEYNLEQFMDVSTMFPA